MSLTAYSTQDESLHSKDCSLRYCPVRLFPVSCYFAYSNTFQMKAVNYHFYPRNLIKKIIIVLILSFTNIQTHNLLNTYNIYVFSYHAGFDGLTSGKQSGQVYSVGEVVTFPEIIYESPNYAPSISRYVCPENGNYLVTLNIMKKYGADLHIGVEHKSHTVLSVADSVLGNIHNQVSNSVLVHRAHNETITVKATGAGEVYGTSPSKYTTFTIMQIHREGTVLNIHIKIHPLYI